MSDVMLPVGVGSMKRLRQMPDGTVAEVVTLPEGVIVQGPKGDKGDVGVSGPKGDAGVAGVKGDAGPQGAPGSSTNAAFGASVTLGSIAAIGTFSRDVSVTGILATDAISVMAKADMPAGIILTGGRVISANTVRLYFQALAILTNNTPVAIAITALR